YIYKNSTPSPSSKGLLNEIETLEKQKILKALKDCNFNQSKAAKILGITRRQLNYRLKKYFQDLI
ncbi:MAG: helix-turn-helix domain-containing protein, partial [Caldimicrobium sp.]